jgi:hypothetical protein
MNDEQKDLLWTKLSECGLISDDIEEALEKNKYTN